MTVKNGTLSKKQKKTLEKAMNAYRADTNIYGFIAVNTKTGRTISYNADFETSSMSTIKAPFLVSLCVYGAKGIPNHREEIRRILQYSDNACYDAMVQAYGIGYVSAFVKSAGVMTAYFGGGYTSYSARSLAKIWCRVKQALDQNQGDIKLIKKYLLFHTRGKKNTFQDWYKKGWWHLDPENGSVLNCGGCGKDWVYAVMSHPSDIYIVPETTQDNLISALYYAVH